MGQYLKNKRSSSVVNGAPKLPTSSQIDYGEIAINFAKGYETISIKNNNGEIVAFSSDSALDKKYIESGAVVTALAGISTDGFFDDAEYDSNTKRINFKNNGTVKDYIDATDFIKDGMVSGVTVSGGNLVISFNTDAGREDISLALTQIFNPNNYYDKDSTDAKFLSAYTETDPVFTGSPAYGITAQDITNWNGKQAAINDLNDIRNNAASGASAYTAVTAHIANTGLHLPAVTSDNNGKILQVVNGAWALVTPVTIYTGNGEPSNVLGNNGDLYLQTS